MFAFLVSLWVCFSALFVCPKTFCLCCHQLWHCDAKIYKERDWKCFLSFCLCKLWQFFLSSAAALHTFTSELPETCLTSHCQTLDKSFSLSPSLPLRLEDSPPQPPRKQQSPSNNGTGKAPKENGEKGGVEMGWVAVQGYIQEMSREGNIDIFRMWEQIKKTVLYVLAYVCRGRGM